MQTEDMSWRKNMRWHSNCWFK